MPEDQPYERQEYQLDMHIPNNYPHMPIQCFLEQELYHINVEQSGGHDIQNRVLIRCIYLNHWHPHTSILQVLLEVLNALTTKPDDSELFFHVNKLNVAMYEWYTRHPDYFLEKAL